MTIRIPLVQINGRLRELPSEDQFSAKVVETFIFEQVYPADVWIIEHNLNKFPSVSVCLEDGTEVFGMKAYNSKNSVTLSFSRPITGKAFLN